MCGGRGITEEEGGYVCVCLCVSACVGGWVCVRVCTCVALVGISPDSW